MTKEEKKLFIETLKNIIDSNINLTAAQKQYEKARLDNIKTFADCIEELLKYTNCG